MKIIILGYGKIGQIIEKLCIDFKIPVVAIITSSDDLEDVHIDENTIVIDFSTADAFLKNIDTLLFKKANIVVGTTGWHHDFDMVKQKVLNADISFCYGSNFSPSVYYFNKIVDFASMHLLKLDQMNVNIEETHHIHKKDAPSGTAITLSNIVTKYSHKPVEIASYRIGETIGEHCINFNSINEDVILTHNAKSKLSYAHGALLSAKYIWKNKGFFNIKDIFDDVL